MFLEAEGPLASCMQWTQLRPLTASFLEGVARLPKQLIGAPKLSSCGRLHAMPASWDFACDLRI